MRVSVFCVAIMLAWPAQAYGLRPLNAGQEESAVANLAHAFAQTGLEELSAERRITLALSPWDELWALGPARPLHVYPNTAAGWRSTLRDAFGRALKAADRLDQGSLAAAIADRLALVWGRPLTPEERAALQQMLPRDQVGQLYWATALHGDMAESAKPFLTAMAFQQRVPGDRLHAWVVSLMQAPLMWHDLGVIATRVVSLDDAAYDRAFVVFPRWLTEFTVHLPLLQSWGYGLFMRDYLTETPVPELLESPVIVWRFADRDMTRWLKDQAPAVERLRWWAGTRSIQPVWEVDGRERTPRDFAATVAFQEPHRVQAIANALTRRDALIGELVFIRSTWHRWQKLFVGKPLPFASGPDRHLALAERSLMPSATIHRVVGWWQRLVDYPLDRVIPRETVVALAAYTLTTLQKEGMSSFEEDPNAFCREIARRFLSESAVANRPAEPTETGLEEDAARRPVGPPSAVEFPWLVDTAAFQAEQRLLAPYQLGPGDAVTRLHQLMLDATLKEQFQLWPGDSLVSWLAKIPVYLVTDPAVWAAYARRVGAADTSPAIVRISKTAGTIILVFNARSLTLGLWIREGIRAQMTRRLLWELLWQRRATSVATSPLTSGWLAAMRGTETAWRALLDQARGPEQTRTLRGRLMELARRSPLSGRPLEETVWDPLRNPAIIEVVATLYTVLLIPDWPLAPPALRDLASWSRRMEASYPIRQWLTAAWATVPELPAPWVGATVLRHDPEAGVPPVPLRMIRRFENTTAVAFSPRGNTVAVVEGEGTIRLWRLPQWEEAWHAASTPRETFTATTFDADSQSLVAVMDLGTIVRWDVTTGALTATIPPVHGGRVVATAFDPDRRRVALGWWDGTVTLQSLTALGQGTSCSFREVDKALAFDPSGRFLAVGGAWGTLGLWDIQQQRFTWQFVAHAERIAALAFSPDDGALFSVGADGTLARWNVSTAEAVWERTVPSRRWTTLAVGPGGRLLVVGGEHGNLRWYEAMTGRSVGASLPAWVGRLAWSPIRPWLATLEPGRILTIWDARLALVWDRLWSAQVPPDVATALQTSRQILEQPWPRDPVQQVQHVLDLRAAVRLWHAAILDAPTATARQGFGSLDGYSRDLLRTIVRDQITLAQALTTVGRARALINEWIEQTVPGLPRVTVEGDTAAWRTALADAPVKTSYDTRTTTLVVTYPMAKTTGLEEAPVVMTGFVLLGQTAAAVPVLRAHGLDAIGVVTPDMAARLVVAGLDMTMLVVIGRDAPTLEAAIAVARGRLGRGVPVVQVVSERTLSVTIDHVLRAAGWTMRAVDNLLDHARAAIYA